MTYGIFLGRCQPFHLGHAHAVNEIYRDGLRPIVLIGSAFTYDDRNPYSYLQRAIMVRTVFPQVTVGSVDDCPEDDEVWWQRVLDQVYWAEDRVWYTHTKWHDRDMGSFFESKGERVKRYVPLLDVNATDIRRDLHGNRQFLDGRVYQLLCRLETQR